MAIACRDDAERAALAAVIGIDPPTLSDDAVAAWTRTLDRADIVAALRAAGVPVSGVEDLGDHHRDPTTRAFWRVLDLPSGMTAEVQQAPVVWDGQRLPLRRAPLWMEHTFDVLVDELGLDPSRFSDLIDAQVLW